MVREVITSYLEPFDGADRFDLVRDFSGPFPVEIISRMLGVPEGERQPVPPPRSTPCCTASPVADGPTHEGVEATQSLALFFATSPRRSVGTPGTT